MPGSLTRSRSNCLDFILNQPCSKTHSNTWIWKLMFRVMPKCNIRFPNVIVLTYVEQKRSAGTRRRRRHSSRTSHRKPAGLQVWAPSWCQASGRTRALRMRVPGTRPHSRVTAKGRLSDKVSEPCSHQQLRHSDNAKEIGIKDISCGC